MVATGWSRGSEWLRWDPHLHTPGTLLNDQFGKDWVAYFAAISGADPAPAALGITDYFTLAGYKEFIKRRPIGAFPGVELVFPNVEMRLTIETRRSKGINLHFLISPQDPKHVERAEGLLSRLTFEYRKSKYSCSDAGLAALGRAYRSPSLSDPAAIREGAGQFKANLAEIKQLFLDEQWLRDNVLVAVAAGNDGLSGLSKDAGFHAIREELGRFANIIFSGADGDRDFWLGHGGDLNRSGLAPRPCLHGSDAHRVANVLDPEMGRLCWIRGDATFESLRQTMVEPERRVFIGPTAPAGPDNAFTLASLKLNADWVENRELLLNPGLVTIIGSKGSGKTALADLLALVAGADEALPGPASFVKKARHLLIGLEASLTWADGNVQSSVVRPEPQPAADPRVQYLSQQFVEHLSNPSTPGDLGEPLVEEIERVVFNSISDDNRLQAADFDELRSIVLENPRASRDFHQRRIVSFTDLVVRELKLQNSVPGLEIQVGEAVRTKKSIQAEIRAIPVTAGDKAVAEHSVANAAVEALQAAIAGQERRALDLASLAAQVERQVMSADEAWEQLRTGYPDLLDATDWDGLKLKISSKGMGRLNGLQQAAVKDASDLRDLGLPAGRKAKSKAAGLAALTAILDELAKALGLNQANAIRRAALEKRLTTAKTIETKLRKSLVTARKAGARLSDAEKGRLDAYIAVFSQLDSEAAELDALYAPLRARLAGNKTLSKLAFDVRRVIDIDSWVRRGEELLDLRKAPFSTRGYLAGEARTLLASAWSTGSPESVRLAMQSFIVRNGRKLIESLVQGATQPDLGRWLYSTDHIQVRYGIEYEGVDIARQSPGTRGVILLTLYLALDEWDLRPLVIDQPEENLDPSSVYDELVPFFRSAARRRQIIMVTHNANLVVNADSDQVIVAKASRESRDALPRVTYIAGGLENPSIRDHVCKLLEGGESAFRSRGERYGVHSEIR